jgi:GT2 family glycosyltransferase
MTLATFLREKMAAMRRRMPVARPDVSLFAVQPALESAAGLPRLDIWTEPAVSIVIPAHGQLPMTLRCLHSIALAGSSIPYEVILVDDASQPALSHALNAVPGLRVARLEARQGFVGAANAGAHWARATLLVFLNNDTAVCPGWLEALANRLQRPGVGLVGGQLISPDGEVQEAGGIIWSDGSASNYGRGMHPYAPAVSFSRSVDYCSGACLMIRRTHFEELGPFDAIYAPGYYEDVDLAFAVRRHGLSVEYEPRARVYHYEGGTAGTDLEVGMKRFQRRNHRVFSEKWARTLELQPKREIGVEQASRHRLTRACLVIDRHLPSVGRDGGSRRLVRLLSEFSNLDWHVTMAAFDLADRLPERLGLEAMGVEVLRSPFIDSLAAYLRDHGDSLDCVVLCRLGVARRLLPLVRRHCPQASVIFDSVDLRSLRETREASLAGDSRALKRALRTERRELAVIDRVEATLVTSPVERDYLRRKAPHAALSVVPTSYPIISPGVGFERRSGALFVGGFRHSPNLDGMLWFLDEVWPQVKLLIPGFQVQIVGEDPPHELIRRARDGVHVHGHVADLSSFFERARMSIAPLRFGAGIKGKVHDTLARGVPCVATPIAAEGLGLMPDIHAVLAESPSRFAEGVTRLNADRDLWQRISIEGRAHVERYFSDRTFSAGVQAALTARKN